MAIDDVDTIDAVGIEPETGYAMLVISDHLDWSDPVAHTNTLQQKVLAYLGFIQQFEPREPIPPLLSGLGEQLGAMGVAFGFGPLPEGYEPA